MVTVNEIEVPIKVNSFDELLAVHIKDIIKETNKNLLGNKNYFMLTLDDGNEVKSCMWLPPTVIHQTGADGFQKETLLKPFMQIIEVELGIPGLMLEPIDVNYPYNQTLRYDTSKPAEAFNLIAEPHFRDEDIFEFRFNGWNGLLNFQEKLRTHTIKENGNEKVVILYNRFVGYHFDPVNNGEILRYYKIFTK